MDLKVGDRVLIKSREWYDRNKDEFGNVCSGRESFSQSKVHRLGKVVTVGKVFKRNLFSPRLHNDWIPFFCVEKVLNREEFIKPDMLTFNELPSLFSHKTDMIDAFSLGCYAVHPPSFWEKYSNLLTEPSQSTEEVKLINPRNFLKLDV